MSEMHVNPNLNIPQAQFLAMPHKFKAFISGFGGGKTWVGCGGVCKHVWEYPKINSGYFAPTYPQIRDIFYPTIEEVAFDWGLSVDIKESNKEVHYYSNGFYRSTTICRSMDKPTHIVGFKIGHALVDEIDILSKEKAQQAWRKIIARMRYKVAGLRNGIDVTTTPEGFKFTHEQFVKLPSTNPKLAAMYGLIQASTYDNELNLPDDYIESMRASYPSQLIDAYIDGQFVNLTSGAVYPEFDRRLNHTDAVLQDGEVLHVGMDFNVLKMAAALFVIRDELPIAVGEHTEVRDTPTMAKLLVDTYADNHSIVIYPDASGHNTSSKDSNESDHTILRQAGLTVYVDSVNPAIKSRLNAVNGMILNSNGERRLLVNTHLCPDMTDGLEQQIYDKHGMPDKKSGVDHLNDAVGYFINHKYPVVKSPTSSNIIMSF